MFGWPVIVKFFTSTMGKGVGALLLLVLAFFYVKHLGYEDGVAAWKPKAEKAQKELKEAIAAHEAEIAGIQADLEAQRAEYERRVTTLEDAQASQVKELETKLAEVTARKEKIREVIKEKIRYVTEKADAACPVPVGAIRLHNLAIEGHREGNASTIAGVAEGSGGDVDARSTVTLSEFTATVADNYANCEERGRKLTLWQQWYHRNAALYGQLNTPMEGHHEAP